MERPVWKLPDLDRASNTGSQVVRGSATPVIPQEVAGFAVSVALVVWPMDQPTSKRRAMRCLLTPISPEAQKFCEAHSRDAVLCAVEVTPEAADEIQINPMSPVAEDAGKMVLAAALQFIRKEGFR